MSSRPAQPEAKLSYAALIDLLEPVLDEVLDKLPSPQQRALEVALLRAEPDETAQEQLAVSVAALGAIRALARERPVIVAIDDVQWLDGPSASVLEFLVRRLRDETVGLLVAFRGAVTDAVPLALETAGLPGGCTRAHVGPLSLAALCQLITERTAVTLSRSLLVRIDQICGGNPFFALEIAVAISRSGVNLMLGDALPVPDNLRSLLAARIAALPSETQDALLVAAAAAVPTIAIAETGRPGVLRHAIDGGVIEASDGRVRFTHPLLAEMVYRLTSPLLDDRIAERRLVAAAYRFAAGDGSRARTLIEKVLAATPRGTRRAQALQLLGQIHYHDDSFSKAGRVLLEALGEAHGDGSLQAGIELEISMCRTSVGDLPAAHSHARQAVRHVAAIGEDGLLAEALGTLTIVEALLGHGVDDQRLAQALALEDPTRQVPVVMRPTLVHGFLSLWTGQLEQGLSVLESLRAAMIERGEENTVPLLSWQLASGAVWKGELDRAERYAAEGLEAASLS